MITRHNYEELFLLYVDNELSAAERLSVEIFVKENPDLLEELDLLRQCKLAPEEKVSFGSLELLLKKKDRRPLVIPFLFNRMTRIAAAAILVLVAGLAIFRITRPVALQSAGPGKNDHALVTSAMPRTLYSTTTNTSRTMAKTNKDIPQRAAQTDHVPMPADAHAPVLRVHAPALADGHAPVSRDRTPPLAGGRAPVLRDHTPLLAGGHAPAPDDRISDDQIPGDQTRDQQLAAARSPVKQGVAVIDPVHTRLPERIFVEQSASRSTSYEALAVYRESAGSPGDDFSEPAPAEKNRLRGILRKVSRVFEKTADRDEDDRHPILVGNLQIALK